jgi:hypothetical protein
MPIQENQTANSPRNQVGYFCHHRIDEKHMGAVLITNQIGVPLEFKYTEPVIATKLHKILYGSVLEKYLHETVIRDRLGREIRTSPNFFITSYDEKEFLGSMSGREMMAVQKCAAPPIELSIPSNRIREHEATIKLEDEPIYLRLAFSTAEDEIQRAMTSWIQDIARTMDILEPLDRIRSALTSLCGDGKKG